MVFFSIVEFKIQVYSITSISLDIFIKQGIGIYNVRDWDELEFLSNWDWDEIELVLGLGWD